MPLSPKNSSHGAPLPSRTENWQTQWTSRLQGPCPNLAPGETTAHPPAHLALAHEVSDVGPQGGATSTIQVLFCPVPAGAARVEIPQEALHGGAGRQRLSHPWFYRPERSALLDGSMRRCRPPCPFDEAFQEAPPLRPACYGQSFLSLLSVFCLCGEYTPTSSLLVTGTPSCHSSL